MLTEVSNIVFSSGDSYTTITLFRGDDGMYEQEVFRYLDCDDDSNLLTRTIRNPIVKLEQVGSNESIYLSIFTTGAWNKQQWKFQTRHHYWVKLPLTGEWVCTNRLSNARRLAIGNSAFSVTHRRCIPAIPF
jgi:hypothetical protein